MNSCRQVLENIVSPVGVSMILVLFSAAGSAGFFTIDTMSTAHVHGYTFVYIAIVFDVLVALLAAGMAACFLTQ